MAFADDLLEQAQHLARREPRRPRQASLRRSVSTAYYALFHLLIAETSANWKRREQRALLARSFSHGRMKTASNRVANASFPNDDPGIVAKLRFVAESFVQLQHERHKADYDNATTWSRTDVLDQVRLADAAFKSWRLIRNEKIAQDYLLSFLADRS